MKSRISILVPLLALSLLMGCSPKSGSGVLSFFFDGVPDPNQKENVAKPEISPKIDTTKVIPTAVSPAGPQMIVHAPYFKRECEACHDNSAASSRMSLSQTSICYKCHTDYQTTYKFQHGPVAAGYCSSCHAPHESVNKKLLKNTGQAMCLLCHADDQVKKNKAHSEIGETVCTQCHNPHGGTNNYFLQ